jgi:hypothetical protein
MGGGARGTCAARKQFEVSALLCSPQRCRFIARAARPPSRPIAPLPPRSARRRRAPESAPRTVDGRRFLGPSSAPAPPPRLGADAQPRGPGLLRPGQGAPASGRRRGFRCGKASPRQRASQCTGTVMRIQLQRRNSRFEAGLLPCRRHVCVPHRRSQRSGSSPAGQQLRCCAAAAQQAQQCSESAAGSDSTAQAALRQQGRSSPSPPQRSRTPL